MNNYNKLKEDLIKYNIELSDVMIERLNIFYEMLVEKNKVMNLTGITEFDEVCVKHYLDSLSLAKYYSLKKGTCILDLGTGAGFPGLPLAIVFQDCNFVLADSLGKRIHFLEEVVEACGITNVELIHSRAEDMAAKKEYREQFDLVVSRAVAGINVLSEYCIPFVKIGGQFISYKSGDCDEEISVGKKAVSVLGGELSSVEKFTLVDTDIERSFVIINKIKSTAKKYPRKAGTPSKEPIV